MTARLVLTAILIGGAASAQTEYFPLHLGNQWVYRSDNFVRAMEIADIQTIGGQSYALLKNGFSGDAWLRMASDGTLYALDPETSRERPWVAFATPEGGSFETALDPCNSRGVVQAVNAKVTVPAGEFLRAFEVRYPAANCADAGLDSEVYAPWIGLVRRSGITLAGPRSFDLIYARIGGVTVLSGPELAFSLTADRSVYTAGRQPAILTARITLRHSQPEPVEIVHGSGQTYDLAIRNQAGDTVYTWSADKVFPAIYRVERYPAGEKNWVETIRLADKDGKPMAPGKYTLEAWLTSLPVQKAWSASLAFEIR